MRRKDREITDFDEIISVMQKCGVCRLALHDAPYPYILPLNFGMEVEHGQITLYFHGANAGKKYELIARDPHVSFEMDCGHELLLEEETGNCTMTYESVMGTGIIEIVPDAEKEAALRCLMSHYRAADFPYNPKAIPATTVMKLTVNSVTAKRRAKKHRA